MLRFVREKFFPIDKIDKNEPKKPKYTIEKKTFNISSSYGTFEKN
jgi:hypothetical protein